MKKYCFVITFLLCCVFTIGAQSTNIEFPTPIGSSEIKGKIPARDIGDSRITTHYYVFDGQQGDIFINIQANNLNGDIDVFLENSLKPLTKISLFAESTPTQTGRELYLRKSERMILRIEGRTPNDDEATYLIKFTGSFQPVAAKSVREEPKLPEVKSETNSDVVVNSVGTIIEIKAKEPEIETTAKTTKGKRNTKSNKTTTTNPKPVTTAKTKKPIVAKTDEPKKVVAKTEESEESSKNPEVIVTDNLPKTDGNNEVATKETAIVKPKTTTTKTTTKKATTAKSIKAEAAAKAKAAANEELTKALENINLVVLFKDGAKIERPMIDVLRFGVDKGVLTIVNKDGSIGRYSIVEITKISVE